MNVSENKPHQPFEGKADPIVPEDLIRSVEAIFDHMELNDRQRVSCAVYLLKMDARIWWDVIKQTRDLNTMTWAKFVQAFSKKCYSVAVLATKVDEFVTLVQGNLFVTDYAQKFDRLAKFAPEVVPTETLLIQRFVRGLKPMIARDIMMTSAKVVSYAKVLDRALEAEYLEDQIWKENVSRRENYRNKGFNEGNKRKANEWQNSGIDKRPRPPATNNHIHNTQNHQNNRNNRYNDRNRGNHQGNKVDHPFYPKCSKRHPGECQVGTNKCFKCSQAGHLRKNFPQWKAEQNNNSNLVSARVFALTQNEAANSNTVVSSQLSISGVMCRVLIYFGATHSYVSMNVIDKLIIPCKLFEHSFSTMLPSGDMTLSTRWLSSTPIMIEGRECPADIIELSIPNYDVIHGMD
ncbi:uncharacterized protein LOC133830766 [Humulus lupulus]|uniref:uncharacterized protein LOC133830766 n=1 Tax=Humulus lupulus TaxID=3486 RepID=UPI002B404437|nr:uncharacterized protein LOC133830766 [Humulus lupulus]